MAARGDGHSVLLLPGFGAGDGSNAPLAAVVRANGCRPHRWGLGRNKGPTGEIIDGMHERLIRIHGESQRRVTLVGVSLGGIFARMLARDLADTVRAVITIGSPFRFQERATSKHPVDVLWRRSAGRFDPDTLDRMRREESTKEPLDVPLTSVFSRFDDIVPWNKCLNESGPRKENVAVRSTHLGLIVHPGVHLVLADRIRQPEGEWTPFRPRGINRMLFARPVDFDPEIAARSA